MKKNEETSYPRAKIRVLLLENVSGSASEAFLQGGYAGVERLPRALPDWELRLARLPEPPGGTRLLSPFDPVLRDRARALRLFGFDYRFEAFVPEPARRFGYYVLPVLEGDRLVGRVDPKFERAEGLLKIRRVFWEPGVRATRRRLKGLEEAAERLARFLGARGVMWPEA